MTGADVRAPKALPCPLDFACREALQERAAEYLDEYPG
jgi:hypothetical protein